MARNKYNLVLSTEYTANAIRDLTETAVSKLELKLKLGETTKEEGSRATYCLLDSFGEEIGVIGPFENGGSNYFLPVNISDPKIREEFSNTFREVYNGHDRDYEILGVDLPELSIR